MPWSFSAPFQLHPWTAFHGNIFPVCAGISGTRLPTITTRDGTAPVVSSGGWLAGYCATNSDKCRTYPSSPCLRVARTSTASRLRTGSLSLWSSPPRRPGARPSPYLGPLHSLSTRAPWTSAVCPGDFYILYSPCHTSFSLLLSVDPRFTPYRTASPTLGNLCAPFSTSRGPVTFSFPDSTCWCGYTLYARLFACCSALSLFKMGASRQGCSSTRIAPHLRCLPPLRLLTRVLDHRPVL